MTFLNFSQLPESSPSKGNLCSTNNFLWGVCEDLESYCRKRRHKWKATLKQVYFNNPWTGISVVAASSLLILTACHTFFTFLYHKFF
uniref:Transmembrane protein n=1 Tax=Populus trichocarpa TaxID=3694 RepID=A0A2K1R788_POPTR